MNRICCKPGVRLIGGQRIFECSRSPCIDAALPLAQFFLIITAIISPNNLHWRLNYILDKYLHTSFNRSNLSLLHRPTPCNALGYPFQVPPQGSGGTLYGECSSSLCLLKGSRPRPTPPEQQVQDPLDGSSWPLLLLLPCPYLELIIQDRTNRRSSHLCPLFLSRWRGVSLDP